MSIFFVSFYLVEKNLYFRLQSLSLSIHIYNILSLFSLFIFKLILDYIQIITWFKNIYFTDYIYFKI